MARSDRVAEAWRCRWATRWMCRGDRCRRDEWARSTMSRSTALSMDGGGACQRVGEFVRINSAGIERINIEAKWAVVHERGSWAAYPDQACGFNGACGLSASASMRRPVQARRVYAHKPVTLDDDERRVTRSLRLNPMRDDAVAKPHIDSAVHRGRGVSTCNHAVNRDAPPPATGIYAHKPSGSRHSPPPLSMQREPRCIGSQIPRLIPRSHAARLYAHKTSIL